MDYTNAIDFFNKINQGNGKFSRLFKPFFTENKLFIYDVGTGKTFECESKEYAFLNVLWETNSVIQAFNAIVDDSDFLQTLNNLITTIKKENLLQALPVVFSADIDALIERANNALEQITLELTEHCNMACKYCIYDSENSDYRGFGHNAMSLETAKASIQYALEHSGNQIAITFYGGEPLLKYDTIQKCIDYALQHGTEKKIFFSLTTNLTLVTPSIANYFASVPNLSVVGSIDGPESIHNENRIFLNGGGSFSSAIRGLRLLVDAFGEKSKSLLSLSMVVAKPVDKKKVEMIAEFFNGLTWLPSEVTKNLSYQRMSFDEFQSQNELSSKIEFNNPINDWSLEQLLEKGAHIEKLFTYDFMSRHLSNIQNRYLSDKPFCNYTMNGCCQPATKKIYVTTSGDFYLCERMGASPSIGNVRDGLNIVSLRKHYFTDYVNGSLPSCADCWAVRMCQVCYVECYDSTSFSIKRKDIACARAKAMLEDQLSQYHTFMTNDPIQLASLSRHNITNKNKGE